MAHGNFLIRNRFNEMIGCNQRWARDAKRKVPPAGDSFEYAQGNSIE
jgi:hypothetical protein